MARHENSFALLEGEEADDETLLERLASKAEVEKILLIAKIETEEMKKQQQNLHRPSDSTKLPSESHLIPPSEHVSAANRGRGRDGQSSRHSGDFGELIENIQPNGYQQNHGRSSGYQRDNGWTNGYQRVNGRVNDYRHSEGSSGGYRKDYRRNDGYRQDNRRPEGHQGNYSNRQDNRQSDDSSCDNGPPDANRCDYDKDNQQNYRGYFSGYVVGWHGQGRGYGGGGRVRGRGRGFNQDQRLGKESQVVNVHNQLKSQGQKRDSGENQEKLPDGQSCEEQRHPRKGKGIYSRDRRGDGGGNRGYRTQEGGSFGGYEGRKDERGDVIKSSETKEVHDNGEDTINGDNNTAECDGAITSEVSKGPEAEQGRHGQNASRKRFEENASRKCFEDATDEEKEAFRKKKAEEEEEEKRKMTLEQYEKQLFEKRKALQAYKTKTEERKITLDKDFDLMQPVEKRKDDGIFIKLHSEKDKLKDSVNKDEKVRKMSINEFLKPSREEKFGRRGGGRYLRHSAVVAPTPAPAPKIEDKTLFPVLHGAAN